MKNLEAAKKLSPLRKSSSAQNLDELSDEQLRHFSIDPASDMGRSLKPLIQSIYASQMDMTRLWEQSISILSSLEKSECISFFNAKRFICFQLAKLLDSIQNPLRKSYQEIITHPSTRTAKGPYPIFDNVTAVFSSTPVITRTATYLYACTEWIDDAFQGREPLHEIYSRLMNPTSVSLANQIVDIEAGPLADQYFAWNFNSGMAAIDGILSHLLGYQDIVIASRNVYGGTHQLLNDWFGKKSNLDIKIEYFDGYSSKEFSDFLNEVKQRHEDVLLAGRHIYVFLESPCNPHGYVLDVAGITRLSHDSGIDVICDCTVGTPFLTSTLKRESAADRPDFIVHSYTKDILGSGTTTAGVVIGRNERMFLPKGEEIEMPNSMGHLKKYSWENTLFWNVYYIKGAFLDADKAFEVLAGMRTMELRVLRKCISTLCFTHVLAAHPMISVKSNALKNNENHELMCQNNYLELPAPLFTVNFDSLLEKGLSLPTFKRFFDSLEPVFGLQVSLGQMNTVVLCPALTSHSELSDSDLDKAGISRTTIRVAIGDEDPRVLLAHLISVASVTIETDIAGFKEGFWSLDEINEFYKKTYKAVHSKYIEAQPGIEDKLF